MSHSATLARIRSALDVIDGELAVIVTMLRQPQANIAATIQVGRAAGYVAASKQCIDAALAAGVDPVIEVAGS